MSLEVKLIEDPEVLFRLEEDLLDKAEAALVASDIRSRVLGIFSIDDLENKTEEQLQGLMAVGVGYLGSRATTTQGNTAQSQGRAMIEYRYMIVFAAPVDTEQSQRPLATHLLTTLRRGVLGSNIKDPKGQAQRAWEFVEEQPVISESSRTMLYYTQVWRVLLPLTQVK